MEDQSPSASVAAPQTQGAGDGLTSEKTDAGKAHFVIQNRAQLIQKVTTVMPIVESLGTMVHPEIYAGIQAEKTSMDQMRRLYTKVINPGGTAVREAFHDALKQHQPHLLKSLGPELPLEDSTQIHAEVPPADLQSKAIEPLAAAWRQQLKSTLISMFCYLFAWITSQGKKTQLNDIFTEVYITEGGIGLVNNQHEVTQIETLSRQPPTQETQINFQDIFQPLPGEKYPTRTVMTKGVAGIGKTVLTQKYTLDWAEGKSNQDIDFLFPFTFRMLNMKKKTYSLVQLLNECFGEIQEAVIRNFNKYKVLFIFDGLDEFRMDLHFDYTDIWNDVSKRTSVGVLVRNLINGNLLPKALIWITTRPAAAGLIPSDHIDRFTDVRGFTDLQKEEFFRKRFSGDENQGTIISHIQTTRSIHIMCHIPVFCWMAGNVLEDILRTEVKGTLPKTQTEVYIHFILLHCKQTDAKYKDGTHGKFDSNQAILSLGKLAFKQLKKGNLIFYEEDLAECGIDQKAAWYSGVFTQIFTKDRGMHDDTVFCFVHLSVQEFLAALHVYSKCVNNPLSIFKWMRFRKLNHLYRSAVHKALESPNGRWDMFLRFLLGLSVETNQPRLKRLLKKTGSRSQTNEETVEYIKEKIRENPSAERSINLFHCLNELNDHSLEEEIQQYLNSGSLSTEKLSPAQWSALVFVLLSSGKELDVFDLKKYCASEEALLMLLPVVKASKKALLSGCNLSETCCEALSSVISSKSSSLRELDLSNNDLQDLGVQKLSLGLGSPDCRVETVRLSGCNLSETCCEALSSVISSKSSSLRELDLSNNDLQDLGVQKLSLGLGSPDCRVETVRLSGCNLSETCCEALSSVISSKSSSLRELDLSNNDLQDLGVQKLSLGLGSPDCRVETVRLSGCMVSEEGCAYLISAVSCNSHLKVLDLSYNHPGDAVNLLSALPLQTLRVEHGGECRLLPDERKYSCSLSLDLNTMSNNLSLSEENRKITYTRRHQGYPDHPERFTSYEQVLCTESLCEGGRYYWEVKRSGGVYIAVCYEDIHRQGSESWFGNNEKSWCLCCSVGGYTFRHNKVNTAVSGRGSSTDRVGVYLDHSAGTLSFYRVTDTWTLLHTVHTTFTQPLYAGIEVYSYGGTAMLCRL